MKIKLRDISQYWIKRIGEEQKPIKFLLSRVLWYTGICNLFIIQREGYLLKFYPTALSASLWLDPLARVSDEELLEKYLEEGDTFVDVGANIGTLTLKAASIIGNKGKVFAFEAHPKTSIFLKKNIKLNRFDNITVYPVALGKKCGIVQFSDKRSDDQNSVTHHSDGISIEMNTLDDILKHVKEISLLKIDTEGYEKFVIEGGLKLLEHTNCVYFESSEKHFSRYGYSTKEILTLLTCQGFNIVKISNNNRLNYIKMSHVSEKIENLLAIRDINVFSRRTQYILY